MFAIYIVFAFTMLTHLSDHLSLKLETLNILNVLSKVSFRVKIYWQLIGNDLLEQIVLIDVSEPKPSDYSVSVWSCFRFICIYPVYINSKKTLAEGRRIPSEKVTRWFRLNFTPQKDSGQLCCIK